MSMTRTERQIWARYGVTFSSDMIALDVCEEPLTDYEVDALATVIADQYGSRAPEACRVRRFSPVDRNAAYRMWGM